MNEDIYDQAADQLERELQRQYPAVRWRVPRIIDLLMFDEDINDLLNGFQLRVHARTKDRLAMVPVSGHFVDDDPVVAAREVGKLALITMERATRSIDVG